MDSKPSSLKKKASILGFDEKDTEALIEIGQSSETLKEFSLRWKQTLPNLPVKNAHLIFDAIRYHSLSKSEDQDDPEPLAGPVDPKRNMWLTRTAVDRTAIMKNLPPEMDPGSSKIPIFIMQKTLFLSQVESRAVIVCRDQAHLARYLSTGEVEMWAARKAKREPSCGQSRVRNLLDEQTLLRQMASAVFDSSALVVDERTATTELLFGLFKKLFLLRSDLVLIFDSSAVIWDRDKLSRFFSGLVVHNLPRETSPVRVLHLEYSIINYLYAAAFLTVKIHTSVGPAGDIIVFLAAEDEIDPVCRMIIERLRSFQERDVKLVVLPVYHHRGRKDKRLLTAREPSTRRVFVTTDSGAAAFDFDTILFSIDSGFETRVSENPSLQTNSLEVAPISRDLASRRAAWAGRAGPQGMCYRLYTEAAQNEEMGPDTLPEIQRANLGQAFLLEAALGINLEFLDCPLLHSMACANSQLYCLGALSGDLEITSLGREMAEFPVGPVHSRILVASSVDFRCSEEALTVVSMVLAAIVFVRPERKDRMAKADLKRVGFFRPEGDHLTLLEIFEAWRNKKFSRQWCLDNFIMHRPMYRAREIRNQLISTMNRLKFEIVSCEKDYTKITKAIASGLFFHAAKRDPQGGCYRAVADDRRVHINSRSALFQGQPSCVVFEDVHVTSDGKEHMIGVTAVDPEWLLELAPRYFKQEGPRTTLMS